MYQILSKRELAPKVNEYVISAPAVAKNARPGQFIILRVDSEGERVPFTICDINKVLGTISILVQTVGATTEQLAELNAGDYILDFVGPLGNPTDLSGFKKVLLIAGGIGGAVILPQAKLLFREGKKADIILGARTKNLLMYTGEMATFAENFYVMTDDGSEGEQGFVTAKLEQLLSGGADYSVAMAVGPLRMMQAVTKVTEKYKLHTIVSMNSTMVDGTGMCGCCRVSVDGEKKYACVDGPEFDGHKVDFEEAIARSAFYREEEAHLCRIRGK